MASQIKGEILDYVADGTEKIRLSYKIKLDSYPSYLHILRKLQINEIFKHKTIKLQKY